MIDGMRARLSSRARFFAHALDCLLAH